MTIHHREMTRAANGAAPAYAIAPHPREGGGAYGWMTPYVAAMAAQNPAFAARALYLTRAEAHFIALALAMMGPARDDADHFGAFARSYGVLSRRTIIESAMTLGGVEAPSAIVNIVPKLAGRVWRPATYRRLAALMADGNARKTLRHLKRITRRQAIMLARLPAPYRTVRVLKMIRRSRDRAEIMFAIEVVRKVRTDLDDRRILVSLEKADEAYIRDWVMRHYERAPFPAPPVPALIINGVEAIRPLASYDDLARAAREFNNCIRDYLWRVLKGDAYFYRYAPEAGGKGAAIVELRKAPVIGWVVHEALGPDNAALRSADRAAVLNAFAREGVGAAPQAAHPEAWFDLG